MKKHILEQKAFIYNLPKSLPVMDGYEYDDGKGYWINQTNKTPAIEDQSFAVPRTKKADVETGEDRKGE